ncbi:hypothetical protein ACJX0J_017885, partial [Zea mays]
WICLAVAYYLSIWICLAVVRPLNDMEKMYFAEMQIFSTLFQYVSIYECRDERGDGEDWASEEM